MSDDASLAKKLYNEQFETYEKNQAQYSVVQDARNILYEMVGNLKSKKVLFVACGDGTECMPAIAQGAHVVGIDISDAAIEVAKKNCPQAQFHVMDFTQLNFEDASFDAIVGLFSVCYTQDLAATLSEFKRVLKSDGCIMLLEPHPVRKMVKYNNSNYFVKGRQKEVWRGIERFGYYRLFEDYVDACVNSGLKIVELKEPKPIKENSETPDAEVNHPHFLMLRLAK